MKHLGVWTVKAVMVTPCVLHVPLQGSATSKHSLMDLRLYMETSWPDAAGPLAQPRPNDILLFIKYYDPKKEELRFCGHMYVDKTLLVSV
jgi:hypothetical protein